MPDPCPCFVCVDDRRRAELTRLIKATKADLRAKYGDPEFDWPALEEADRRSREDPEWYKRKG